MRVDHLGLDYLDFMDSVGVDGGHVLVNAEAGATNQYCPANQRDRTAQSVVFSFGWLWVAGSFLNQPFFWVLSLLKVRSPCPF